MWMSSRRVAILAASLLMIGLFAGAAVWFGKSNFIEFGGTDTGQLVDDGTQNAEPGLLNPEASEFTQQTGQVHTEPDLIFVGQTEPAIEESSQQTTEPAIRRPRSRIGNHADESTTPLLEFPETTKTESHSLPVQFPQFPSQAEPRVLSDRQTQAKRTKPSLAPQFANEPTETQVAEPKREEVTPLFGSDSQPTLQQARRFPTSVALVDAQQVPEPKPDPEPVNSEPAFAAPKTQSPFEAPTQKRTASRSTDLPESAGKLDLKKIDQQIEKGDFVSAHRDLSAAYWNDPAARAAILPRIEKTAQAIYFSPQPHFIEPYTIQPGDRLQNIAAKYQLAWPYLASLNKVDPKRIRAGQKLKVIKGPLAVFVDLSDFELTVHAHGFFVKRFEIGIGKDGASPLGKFTVLEKVEKPQYTDPNGKVIAGGHPTNPLGTHWIDIGNSFGIHGTIEPSSIGKAESRGCIRMRNEEVEEVYNFLVKGSEVVIRQ